MLQSFRSTLAMLLFTWPLIAAPRAGAAASDRAGGAPFAAVDSLSLPEARERAVAMSPDLRAARHAAAAAGAAARQARAWSNPEIGVEAEEFGGDRPGWDEAELTWTLAQKLEIFGTRGARTRAAVHASAAAAQRAEAARLDLLAEVDTRFADALFAQARLKAFAAHDTLAAEAVRAATALSDAGEVSPIEVERAKAERVAVTTRLAAARLEYAGALRSLARLWGSIEPDFSSVKEPPAIEETLPAREAPLSTAPELPDLRSADAEIRQADAELSLSSRTRWPELVLRGGVKRVNAGDLRSYAGGVALSLPLLDRRGGAIDEARAKLSQARAERDALRSRIALARASAYDALAAAIGVSQAVEKESLPLARTVVAAVREGYQRGKFGLLELLDAQRFLLQTELEQIDALRSVRTARAELDRWTGPAAAAPQGEIR